MSSAGNTDNSENDRRQCERREMKSDGFTYITTVGWICRREQCRYAFCVNADKRVKTMTYESRFPFQDPPYHVSAGDTWPRSGWQGLPVVQGSASG